MKASDIMIREVITIHEDATIEELCDLLQEKNIKGVPVVDDQSNLVGIVAMDDIVYGTMGHPRGKKNQRKEKVVPASKEKFSQKSSSESDTSIRVKHIMTSPAIFAEENSECIDVCNIMWKFRIHRVPIVKGKNVTGIISALDLCKAISARNITL